MLGNWRKHTDYQRFMIDKINQEFKRDPRVIEHYEATILKMFYLNLDNVQEDFQPLFSLTGKPSNQQPEIFRSFILMSHFKHAGIDEWVKFASMSPMLCALVGVSQESFPGASTHRDFMERLWLTENPSRRRRRRSKPRSKHGKQKLPPKHPGIVAYMAKKALSGEIFKQIPERLLQTIFMKTAVIPSANAGLLGNTSKVITSGDGACVQSHASPYGHKTCNCKGKCDCPRKFADPEAKWGWDSYHEQWFYGYTAYLLSVHNKKLKLDLPIYMKFVDASRNDSVTLIPALAHARYLYKDILNFDSLLADAIHDNYPTYELLNQWRIKPFIALNSRSGNKPQPLKIHLSKNGIPICADGYEMVRWGLDWRRYRIKYRCPLVCGKVKSCPYSAQCNNSAYGKIVYIRLASDLRLRTPIPRESPKWAETYKLRTASERVNNRLLTDYQLERHKRYGKAKLATFAFWNAINIHLDALIKVYPTSALALLA